MKLGFAFLILAVLASGCGRADTVYSDGDAGLIVIEHSALPAGFYDQSVNHADAMAEKNALRLRLRGGAAAPGSFNDASLTGNIASVGLGDYDKKNLSDFSLAIESTSDTTTTLNVSLVVDLDCDSAQTKTLQTSLGVGSTSVDATDSTIAAVLADHPAACLKNALSEEDTAPKGVPVAALRIWIGSGTSTSIEDVSITKLTLYGDVHDTWSAQ